MGNQLFQRVLKALKEREVQGARLIVGVSGGIDSIVLLHLLRRAAKVLRLKLFVFHAHHGRSSDPALSRYRARALAFVRKAAAELALPFAFAQSEKELLSEAAMREFRHSALLREKTCLRARFLALGHNRDDLLETRLIHLIRGCGRAGLRAEPSAHLIKPLSSAPRKDIECCAKACSLKWIEDPGNKSAAPLRNWLRQKWLPLLEKKRPGSLEALARSLSLISEYEGGEAFSPAERAAISGASLRRRALLELPPAAASRVIARFMRERRLSGYGLSHIEEARKNIGRPEKTFRFRLLKRVWRVSPDTVSLAPDSA